MVDRVVNIAFTQTGGAAVVSNFQRIGAAATRMAAQTKAANTNLAAVGGRTAGINRGLAATTTSLNRTSKAARGSATSFGLLGRASAVFAASFSVDRVLRATIGDFVTFERGLIGVAKTTDFTATEMESFGRRITEMTKF